MTEVKQNARVQPATDQETDFFIAKKRAWAPKTGLNFFDDERLIRAREAICLAVQVFNSPTTNFKTEVFSVLANIALICPVQSGPALKLGLHHIFITAVRTSFRKGHPEQPELATYLSGYLSATYLETATMRWVRN
ncbi:DUF3644 domain-containing protein [Dongia soli]|uniref:DUF3644 domain-containing protein n=1 Tax=Dongia soli TaxID=600628 RepID=UPI00360DC961